MDWHLEDVNRFRVLYAVSQLSEILPEIDPAILEARVYPVSHSLYGALAERLGEGTPTAESRQLGIALHMCVLGIAAYQGTLEKNGESFAHDWHDVVDSLARAIAPESTDDH